MEKSKSVVEETLSVLTIYEETLRSLEGLQLVTEQSLEAALQDAITTFNTIKEKATNECTAIGKAKSIEYKAIIKKSLKQVNDFEKEFIQLLHTTWNGIKKRIEELFEAAKQELNTNAKNVEKIIKEIIKSGDKLVQTYIKSIREAAKPTLAEIQALKRN